MKRLFLTTVATALSLLAGTAIAEEAVSSGNPGDVWWSEYLSANPESTSQFYSAVIGWKTRSVALEDLTRSPKPGEKAYIMMMNGADETAGLMSLGDADYPGARTGWFTYFYVEDLEGALDRAIHQGGRIVREPVDVSDETRIAVIADPEGVLVGLASRPKD